MNRTRTSRRACRLPRAGAIMCLALALAATGCGAVSAAQGTARAAVARLDGMAPGPSCRASWLTVSISQVPGGTRGGTTRDAIRVSSSHTCTLEGWPVLEKVLHPARPTGATPGYTTITEGHPALVEVGPGRPAVASATVLVPKGWIWGGGNLCASFPSALVRLPGIRQGFFVERLPAATVSCGGPAREPVRVTVGPLAAVAPGTGGVAVPFGQVELSVPGRWWVEIPGVRECLGPPVSGELVLGTARALSALGCARPATVVYLVDIKRIPPKYAHKRPVKVHGVAVIVGPSGKQFLTWYLPGVLEEVVARGPLGRATAASLRFSPRRRALSGGTPEPSTRSWHRVSFGGLSAEVPSTWKVVRTGISNYPVCGTDETSLPRGEILFDADRRSSYPPCPFQFPTASALFGSGGNGLRVDLLPARPPSGRAGLSRVCFHPHGLTACPYASPQMGVLELLVTGGDLTQPRLVWIGLGGSGELAETVLASLSGSLVVQPV